jgi:hypothetical protein
MNRNLQDSGLGEVFEQALMDLARLESKNDTTFQESSSSLRLLTSLVKYLSSLRKTDDTLASCISFKLKLIETLVANYGVNEVIKSSLQAITHRLVKSFEFIATRLVDQEQANSLMNLLFKIVLKDVAREDLTVFLLQEV